MASGKNVFEGFAEFAGLPQWDTQWTGGVDLISPGHEAQTTLYPDPGHYIVEFYLKINSGVWHANMGIIKELVVIEEQSNREAPEGDVEFIISSEPSIEFGPPVNAGLPTFSVFFFDQVTHENFVGHDVKLVKIESDANENVLKTFEILE